MVTQVTIQVPANDDATDNTAAANAAAAAGVRRTAAPTGNVRQTRARIDPAATTPGQQLTPLQAALSHVESHTASLHDGLSTLLLEKSKQLLLKRQKIHQKTLAISRLEKDPERLPASARIQFKLNVCKELEDDNEFINLKGRNERVTQEYTKKLKLHIIEAAKLEIKLLKTNLIRQLAKSFHDVVAIYHVSQEVPPSQNHPTALQLLAEHDATLLKHDDEISLSAIYTKVNGVGALTQDERNNINGRRIEIWRIINAIFVEPWDTYKSTFKAKELAISLKKHARETMTEEATADATAMVDNELPADREQLNTLIRTEALKIAKDIINKKSKLNKDNQSKNKRMGQPRGASQTNGRNTNLRRQSQQNNKGGQRNGQREGDGQQERATQRNTQQRAGAHNNANARRSRSNSRSRNRSNKRSNAKNSGGNRNRQQS